MVKRKSAAISAEIAAANSLLQDADFNRAKAMGSLLNLVLTDEGGLIDDRMRELASTALLCAQSMLDLTPQNFSPTPLAAQQDLLGAAMGDWDSLKTKSNPAEVELILALHTWLRVRREFENLTRLHEAAIDELRHLLEAAPQPPAAELSTALEVLKAKGS
jgi:hypothetical protein